MLWRKPLKDSWSRSTFLIVITDASSMKAILIVEESRHSNAVKGFLCKLSIDQCSLGKDFSRDCKTFLAIVDLLHWESFPLVIFTLGQVIPLVFPELSYCVFCILYSFGLGWKWLKVALRFKVFFSPLRVNSKITWFYCAGDKKHCSHTVHGSHDTIYTFKNYFVTVFSVFSFSNNKFIPNGPFYVVFTFEQYWCLFALTKLLNSYIN